MIFKFLNRDLASRLFKLDKEVEELKRINRSKELNGDSERVVNLLRRIDELENENKMLIATLESINVMSRNALGGGK